MNWYCEICGRNYGSNPPDDLKCKCGSQLTTKELKEDKIGIFVREKGDKDA